MPDLESFPFAAALVFLVAVAVLRGQATYALARVVTEQTLRRTRPTTGWPAAVHRWLDGDAVGRGRAVVQRWGMAAVAACDLTVGLQTIVLAGAGAVRMPWPRFTLAQLPGALAWALIYATVGFAVWSTVIAAALTGNPVLTVLVCVLVVALLIGGRVLRRSLLRRGRLALDDREDRDRPAGRPGAPPHAGVDDDGGARRDVG